MHTCCRQVRDFLDHGRKIHADLHALYAHLAETPQQEPIRLLLDYLSRHEQHLADNLARFEHDARRSILDAWLEHAPRLQIDALIENAPTHADMQLDEVVRMAAAFDDALVALYREVAESAKDARVRAVFEDLVQLEDSEKVQMLRSAAGLWDM